MRTKDAAVLLETPEMFLSVLLLDGVFERHPGLRGAAVELGAGWVPEMCRRLDWVTRIYGRSDESVRFKRAPSQQLIDQMAFTPFFHEDAAYLMDDSHPNLYLFSSDYLHLEGTKDPIGRFERFLEKSGSSIRDAFYGENF